MSERIVTIKITSCIFCPHRITRFNYCQRHGVQLSGFSSSMIEAWEKNIKMDGHIPAFCTLPKSNEEKAII